LCLGLTSVLPFRQRGKWRNGQSEAFLPGVQFQENTGWHGVLPLPGIFFFACHEDSPERR
jgi:hypothetical protein